MKKYPIGTPVKEHRMHQAAIGKIKRYTDDGGAYVETYNGDIFWVAGGLIQATAADAKRAEASAARSLMA